jgi:hypothetical protein
MGQQKSNDPLRAAETKRRLEAIFRGVLAEAPRKDIHKNNEASHLSAKVGKRTPPKRG